MLAGAHLGGGGDTYFRHTFDPGNYGTTKLVIAINFVTSRLLHSVTCKFSHRSKMASQIFYSRNEAWDMYVRVL